MILSSKERITRIFQNKETDRPALKLWGADISENFPHPAYAPVHRLAMRTSDLFASAGSPFSLYSGQNNIYTSEYEDTADPLWKIAHSYINTPKGLLHQAARVSTIGEPSYTIEYALKQEGDLDKLLSIPYEPFPFDASGYFQKTDELGDRGVVMFGLDHAGYGLQRLAGSENIAYFSVDCREKVDEIISIFSGRIREHAKKAIDAGIKIFDWVGPELLIPPLMSLKDFEDFCFANDKPICDDIHDAGGYTWLHCHGKVFKLIPRFIEMGIDVLNPLEPPKNGDIDLPAAIEKYQNKIGWEGNIEIQDILLSPPEQLRELIRKCAEAGAKSGRFIMCPSAGYAEYVSPSELYINNLLLYLDYGLECLKNSQNQ